MLINKPPGTTSFGVVAAVRRLLGVRKVGHTGTLDPFAVGLLPVCVGRATRLVPYMEPYDKAYQVLVAFGRSTDTMDGTGTSLSSHQLTDAERADLLASRIETVRQAVLSLKDITRQQAPLYSAVKVKGKKLYQYARAGQAVEQPERPVRIDEARLDEVFLDAHVRARVTIRCSKGTYIRSLSHELGQMTGWGAHAAELKRLSCGPYELEDAVTVADLSALTKGAQTPQDRLAALKDAGVLLPFASAVAHMPAVALTEDQARRLIYGQTVLIDQLAQIGPEPTAFFLETELVAIGSLDRQADGTGRIHTERVLMDLADLRR